MEIRQLRYFVALATHLSFTEAAQSLFVTRQALSKSIKQLESKLGMRLISIEGKQVELTEKGMLFLKDIEPLLEEHDKINAKYSQASKDLTLAIAHGSFFTLPNNLVELFVKENDSIDLAIEEGNSNAVLNMVRRGEAEIGILGTHPRYLAGFEYVSLAHPGYFINVPKCHPLAQKERLELADLDGQYLVTLGKNNHLHRLFMEECTKHRVEPLVLLSSTNKTVLEEYFKQGLALSFACTPGDNLNVESIKSLPLNMIDSEIFGTHLVRAKNSYFSQHAQLFWKYMLDPAGLRTSREGT